MRNGQTLGPAYQLPPMAKPLKSTNCHKLQVRHSRHSSMQ